MQRSCSIVALALIASTTVLGQTVAVVGGGYTSPTPIPVAPGQVITVFVEGVGASLTQPVRAQGSSLPTMLAGISATLKQLGSEVAVPLLSVQPICLSKLSQGACRNVTAVTVQIPFELQTLCASCESFAAVTPQLFVSENGRTGNPIDLTPLADQIHILTACDLSLPNAVESINFTGLPCAPMVTHADGSLVSAAKPAKAGEELVAYAVGLGLTDPRVPTGQQAAKASPTAQTFSIDYNYRPNALATKPQAFVPDPPPLIAPIFAGLTPSFVGLYQINFLVLGDTAGIPPCADSTNTALRTANIVLSNLTVSFGGAFSFDGVGICVVPGT